MTTTEAEPFVLDRVENPHPRMLAAAIAIRERAGWAAGCVEITEARAKALGIGRACAPCSEVIGRWKGYLAAMADATGCDPADIEAWMDRAVPAHSDDTTSS